MRMIWQAIRAVTIEVMGVGAVIFLLFGAAGWTVESAAVQPKQEVDRAWNWLRETSDDFTASIQPNLTADERESFAAERLDYYGTFYGEAADSYANRAVEHLQRRAEPADQKPALPTNQLLGTL
ncbi:MAG: hypothetical protein H8E66_22400 [Planctomycetes bacterium]|nr:hypothetical protein [Planctomycetota bacterium]